MADNGYCYTYPDGGSITTIWAKSKKVADWSLPAELLDRKHLAVLEYINEGGEVKVHKIPGGSNGQSVDHKQPKKYIRAKRRYKEKMSGG